MMNILSVRERMFITTQCHYNIKPRTGRMFIITQCHYNTQPRTERMFMTTRCLFNTRPRTGRMFITTQCLYNQNFVQDQQRCMCASCKYAVIMRPTFKVQVDNLIHTIQIMHECGIDQHNMYHNISVSLEEITARHLLGGHAVIYMYTNGNSLVHDNLSLLGILLGFTDNRLPTSNFEIIVN